MRVIVADDHPLYRQGIVRALEAAGETVLAEAADGLSALDLIRREVPDVAVVDVRMPGLDGIDVIGALARHGPAVPVVLLSAFSDEPLVRAGLQAGAAAYVAKTADRAEIVRAVKAAAVTDNAPRTLTGGDDLVVSSRGGWIPRLTLREHEALILAHRGLDKPQIAVALGIDEAAVHHALSVAVAKLGADTLTEALEAARQARLLS
jgi:two-component system, NarL family, nitrate/nitrite response regulator NarL